MGIFTFQVGTLTVIYLDDTTIYYSYSDGKELIKDRYAKDLEQFKLFTLDLKRKYHVLESS